jgi:hypothetical protein
MRLTTMLSNLYWPLAAAALSLSSAYAQAQASSSDKAAAETLFERGRELNRDHKYAEACARFEQSQAIEPSLGTMLYLADCYEKIGRSASAWALFLDAASQAAAAGQNERAQTGRRRAEQLEGSLSKLRLFVPAEHEVAGLELVRNGTPLGRGVWGVVLPIDPGEYVIEARAPHRTAWSTRVRVEPGGQNVTVTVPELAEAPGQAQMPAPLTPPAGIDEVLVPLRVAAEGGTSRTPPLQRNMPREEPGTPVMKIVGAVAAGVGVVGLAVGGVYGLRAIAKNDSAKEFCPGGGKDCNEQRGLDLTKEADRAANAANVLMIGGGVLLVAGAIAYWAAPASSERPRVALDVAPGRASVQVAGRF